MIEERVVDFDIEKFIAEYIDSLVTWAVIVFYHENPGARDRAGELALRLGRRIADVERAAEKLAEKGVLKRVKLDSDIIYVYEPEEAVRDQIDKFVRSLDDREVRLSVLSRVFDKMG